MQLVFGEKAGRCGYVEHCQSDHGGHATQSSMAPTWASLRSQPKAGDGDGQPHQGWTEQGEGERCQTGSGNERHGRKRQREGTEIDRDQGLETH